MAASRVRLAGAVGLPRIGLGGIGPSLPEEATGRYSLRLRSYPLGSVRTIRCDSDPQRSVSMRPGVRWSAINVVLAVACALPVAAQSASVMGDLASDVAETEKKFIALAKAMPADKYDWRPMPGVRSVGEVFRHVASDNYLIPALLGTAADPATGITGD